MSVSVINRRTDAGLQSLCVRFDQFHPLYRMLFLLCLTFFVQAYISEIQQHVHCDLQNIQDIERPCQEEQPALVRIIGVIDDFSCDTEYIADYCKHVILMKDGRIAWKLPVAEALRRVDELQECNIFPPQVTIAAHRMNDEKFGFDIDPLPTTVEEGRKAFMRFVEKL